MGIRRGAWIAAALLLCLHRDVQAEVLLRWDQEHVPSRESLGIGVLVVPAKNPATVRSALAQGYRVFLEVEPSMLRTVPLPRDGLAGLVVRGPVSAAQLLSAKQRLRSPGARVLILDERGRWPHIRSNWVTKNNEVLQVTGRSAQPWIENNAALLQIIERTSTDAAGDTGVTTYTTYTWKPVTISEQDEGPALANYLVAIAEAGSFGGNLVLPLHERFQKSLLLGKPQARRDWKDIRGYLEFYSWTHASRYEPIATIGVVTAEPMLWYEPLNLLARHNLPFTLIAPREIARRSLATLKLLIVLDDLAPAQLDAIAAFERTGGKVFKPENAIADPNGFALEMRQILGREHRAIDIWNGITVLATPFKEPDGTGVLVAAVNYAHDALPVQLRIPGTFASISYETPEDPPTLLPVRHRDGHTEFVLPALRIGGRVFLSR